MKVDCADYSVTGLCKITDLLDKGNVVNLIYLDFSRVFAIVLLVQLGSAR